MHEYCYWTVMTDDGCVHERVYATEKFYLTNQNISIKTKERKNKMNKFTNVFDNDNNYISLKKALVEWVLGTDGMNGATGEVLGQIPWTNEMEDLISWDKVDRKFDEAIGLRGDWNVYYLTSTSSVYDTYRDNFNLFINEKALAIVKVYENVINELNNMNKKCVVVEKFVGVDKNGFCKYKTIEKFYFDSYGERRKYCIA